MCVVRVGVEVRKITHPFPRKVFLIIFFPFLIKLDLLAHFEAQSPSHLGMGQKGAYDYRQKEIANLQEALYKIRISIS